MVSKIYIRLRLARCRDGLLQEYLREESEEMEYLMSVGEQTFLKSKEADITQLMKSKQVDSMQLITASARGDRKQVQLLLGMGADVNMRDTVSHTSIHIVVYV